MIVCLFLHHRWHIFNTFIFIYTYVHMHTNHTHTRYVCMCMIVYTGYIHVYTYIKALWLYKWIIIIKFQACSKKVIYKVDNWCSKEGLFLFFINPHPAVAQSGDCCHWPHHNSQLCRSQGTPNIISQREATSPDQMRQNWPWEILKLLLPASLSQQTHQLIKSCTQSSRNLQTHICEVNLWLHLLEDPFGLLLCWDTQATKSLSILQECQDYPNI